MVSPEPKVGDRCGVPGTPEIGMVSPELRKCQEGVGDAHPSEGAVCSEGRPRQPYGV
jgi:hypothetical protein